MDSNQSNKVLEIINLLLESSNVPESTMNSLNGICQLYKFNRVRSFIRKIGTDQFVLLDESNYGQLPKSNNIENGIDFKESFYRKDGAQAHKMMELLLEKTYIHTYDFNEYQEQLEAIGYIPSEGKKVIEACLRCVVSADAGMMGYFVFERYEGTKKLEHHEILEIQTLCSVINGKIESFEAKKQLKEEEMQNEIDFLTGLPVLRVFKENVNELLLKKEKNNNYAMIHLDIDKFKYINEIWSRETGDDILIKTSAVIKNQLFDKSICSRISDDKFVVFIHYENPILLEKYLKKLNCELVNMQKQHFKDVKITIIGGIYLVSDEMNVNLMIDKANIARRSSKGTFENTFVYYSRNLENLSEREKQLENRMTYAVENKEFIPVLQPKFNLKTNEICGAEALARWKIEEKMISPAEFIPLFEKNGFITKLDFVIYEATLEFMRKTMDKGMVPVPISMNVSRGHMSDDTFLGKIEALLAKYQIPRNLIELEITESFFTEDEEQLKAFIEKIRKANITVSIDDFGSAYSSLNLLKDVVVDKIKIDKSFIDNFNSGKLTIALEKDKIIVKNIISMLNELDFKTIFEGIETRVQVDFLKEIGCQYGQGYYFERPLSLEAFQEKYL